MSAIRNSIRLGVKNIELDIIVTADGRAAVTHDDNPDRTTDCDRSVSSSYWESLVDCDAAYWWRPGVAYTSHSTAALPLRGAGIRIPELAEVIDYLKTNAPDFEKLIVEMKVPEGPATNAQLRSIATTVAGIVIANQFDDHVILTSFARQLVDYAKALAPQIESAIMVGPGSGFDDCLLGVQYAIGRGHNMVLAKSDSKFFNSTCSTYAHDGQVQLMAWTIDRPETLDTFRSVGVDGVISNFPACMMGTMGQAYPLPVYTTDLHQNINSPLCAVH